MNKLVVSMFAAIIVFAGCSKDDEDKGGNGNGEKLITPELATMATTSNTSFTGVLLVHPCLEDTSIYYGNYNKKDALSSIYAYYTIGNGSVVADPIPVKLPLGDYNFIYWGICKNSQVDSTYNDVAVNDPPLRIGTNLAELNYTLRKENYSDTTYFPVFDYVFARQDIVIGTDKMQATLARVVAGLKISITNSDGSKMDQSIASTRILVGSIANQMNYYTSVPSDFTKTVAFPLSMSADSLTMSANSTVMMFPSGNSPLLSILITLKNGQVKKFQKPLDNTLSAGNRLTLNIKLGDLYSEGGASDGFEVEDWTESTETIDFPAG